MRRRRQPLLALGAAPCTAARAAACLPALLSAVTLAARVRSLLACRFEGKTQTVCIFYYVYVQGSNVEKHTCTHSKAGLGVAKGSGGQACAGAGPTQKGAAAQPVGRGLHLITCIMCTPLPPVKAASRSLLGVIPSKHRRGGAGGALSVCRSSIPARLVGGKGSGGPK